MGLSISERRLGSELLQRGLLDDRGMTLALQRQSGSGELLVDILIETGAVTERELSHVLQEAYQIPTLDLDREGIDLDVARLLPGVQALEWRLVPVREEQDQIMVACLDPLSSELREKIEDQLERDVKLCFVRRDALARAQSLAYPDEAPPSPPLQIEEGDQLLSDFGHYLLEHGYVNRDELLRATEVQRTSGEPLGACLLYVGALTEERLYEAISAQSGVPLITLASLEKIPPSAYGYMTPAESASLEAVPVGRDGDVLIVAVQDLRRLSMVEQQIGRVARPVLARGEELSAIAAFAYPPELVQAETAHIMGRFDREHLLRAYRAWAAGEIDLPRVTDYAASLFTGRPLDDAPPRALEDTLVSSGKLNPELLARSMASQLGYEFIEGHTVEIDPQVIAMVPEAAARRYSMVPLRLMPGGALMVGMRDPRNVFALDDLKVLTGRQIVPAVMTEKDITRLIERLFDSSGMEGLSARLVAETKAREEKSTGGEPVDLEVGLDDNAVVRAVDAIIREAALQEASDIHVEPTERELQVRYRVDGSLRAQPSLPKASAVSILARIKIMGKLDISEKRVPQDGRIRFRKGSVDLDLRLSTLPIAHGEKAVMRLLQKAENIPQVEQLGFSEHNYRRYSDVIQKPNGIFLVTGPTGSGKSFTSFSTLKRIARPDKNTTTIEDPIEYEIPGIIQSQVNNAAGMTFARALRAFLRQDPDIIFVGEIRDQETAKIAVEAALTGHLVLATLHTNDAPGAITRLEEMGLESFNIAAAVVGVLAQRLVRRVCKECAQPTNADPDVLRRLGLQESDIEGATLMRGAGCARCGGTGYKGRMGIHELMVIDEPLRRAIGGGKSVAEIRDVALAESGMKTLREDGLGKAMEGLTTLDEVLAVTSS